MRQEICPFVDAFLAEKDFQGTDVRALVIKRGATTLFSEHRKNKLEGTFEKKQRLLRQRRADDGNHFGAQHSGTIVT